jgi:two-component system chemotaxis response regulator CheB
MDDSVASAPAAATLPVAKPSRVDSPGRDIVTVGASAGGPETLRRLVAGLPEDFRGSLFVVVHIPPDGTTALPQILSRAGVLPAMAAEDGMAIERGRIYVAPNDRHLLVERDRISVVRGPRENRARPAIDPLFRSAAWAYGPRVVGVLLSGALDDGTAGLWAIKSCGGTTIVQDPADATNPEMPQNALIHNRVDHRLAVEDIGPLLARLAREPAPEAPAPPASIGTEIDSVKLGHGLEGGTPPGSPSPFTCPTCGGALWELDEGGHLRYRCHTGHAYTHGALLQEQGRQIETGVYTALRAVEQKSAALRRLADSVAFPSIAKDYQARASELDEAASALRSLLRSGVG